MENHSYDTIIGSPKAPYINALAAKCGLATNYHNISHPSLPNYVGATSGLRYAALLKFKPDCDPRIGCTTTAASIFGQGEKWKAYQQSMPANCYRVNSGAYAVRHNPPPYYDMHDGTIAEGNNWLAANLPTILNSDAYRDGSTVVFLTWDEGRSGTVRRCATNTTDVGCHVATIVLSPSTKPGTRSSRLFNHYSLLGTTEQLLGLRRLGLARYYRTMTAAFRL
jgi:phosphatidylinositol-3-phosphatase